MTKLMRMMNLASRLNIYLHFLLPITLLLNHLFDVGLFYFDKEFTFT